ncbi:MAG TPA: class I SAM-dependent methyltransferase [Kineosporiaceae bacterium]|nr:class I SAM-dependent methyltransferase [Kineosporiaceae bacterium]
MSNPWVNGLDPAESAERASAYSRRFEALAARGENVHGEADLVAALLPNGGAILDAGCGTGRVAARLAEQGFRAVGVDLDPSMLGQARLRHPTLTWIESDLADLDLELADRNFTDRNFTDRDLTEPFDAVVAAGNVMPLLTPGTESKVITVLAGLLSPGGLLIAGFGLDDAHLPPSAPASARFRSLAEYDRACSAAQLRLRERWAGWDRARFDGGGYAVSVHVRA